MYHIFFTHSSVNGHLDCFYVLAIVITAAINSVQCKVRGSIDFGVRQIEVQFKGMALHTSPRPLGLIFLIWSD